MNRDQECTFRVGEFRVVFWPVEGGMSVEAFMKYRDGNGAWFVAHEEDHDLPDAKAALNMAYAFRQLLAVGSSEVKW